MTSEELKQLQLLGSLIRPPAQPDPASAQVHAAISLAIKTHGVAAVARKLDICRETLVKYISHRCRLGTRELIERRADRV